MGSTHRTGRAGTDHIHDTRTSGRPHRKRSTAAIVGVAVLGLAACGADDDTGATTAADAPAEFAEDVGRVVEAEAPGEAVVPGDAPATGGTSSTGAPLDLTFGRDLIVEAGVTMLTPNVREAVDDVIDIVGRNGGAVFSADVTVDDPLDDGSVPGRGTIVVRIPPPQLDLLIDDLRGVGTLRNQTQSVDDVTDRLIDLDIQIRQAFESVERMEAILAGTTDFDSLVAAETELVRRQTAYERLLAAQRTIDDRVALSTLTIDVEYQSPAVEDAPVDDSDKGIGDAFSDGWSAFVGVLFAVAFVLAIGTPFLAVGSIVMIVGWFVSRRLRRPAVGRQLREPLADPAIGDAGEEQRESTTVSAATGPAGASPPE